MEIKEVTTGSKLESFFTILNQLIVKGKIKRGKDFRLMEECNGKVLSLHMESIYASYAKTVGVEAVSLMDIRHMLQNSQFFIKYAKVVQFRWKETLRDAVTINHTVNISAPLFCYATLKEKYNINLERYTVEEVENALLAKGISFENLDDMKLQEKYVSKTVGYINNQKHTWNSRGECFMKNGTPNKRYNLTFE